MTIILLAISILLSAIACAVFVKEISLIAVPVVAVLAGSYVMVLCLTDQLPLPGALLAMTLLLWPLRWLLMTACHLWLEHLQIKADWAALSILSLLSPFLYLSLLYSTGVLLVASGVRQNPLTHDESLIAISFTPVYLWAMIFGSRAAYFEGRKRFEAASAV